MKKIKKIAVYLDHQEARLFDFRANAMLFKTIDSDFYTQDKRKILQKGESHLHHKEKQFEAKYYEAIANEIVNFNEVLLFGTTNAKTELFNYLMKANHFVNCKFTVENSDSLTENQQLAFVNSHFRQPK
jgi:stalled ribosome rescue protein Dom34